MWSRFKSSVHVVVVLEQFKGGNEDKNHVSQKRISFLQHFFPLTVHQTFMLHEPVARCRDAEALSLRFNKAW